MIINHFKQLTKNFIYKIKYLRSNITIPLSCNIGYGSKFEGYNKLGEKTSFHGKLGLCSYIGENCKIDGKIGRFCSIANDVIVLSGTHPTKIFVSTSPVFFAPSKQCGISFTNDLLFEQVTYADKEKKYSIIVGNDVWIGARATILSGVTIGDGAIIAANALVTKDVSPYTIVGGVPAKPIRSRFTDEEISFLLNFKWWEKDFDWIRDNASDFIDIKKFKKSNSVVLQ
jgi:acetyltransferase-like isoleucine patch superfamily enzyme